MTSTCPVSRSSLCLVTCFVLGGCTDCSACYDWLCDKTLQVAFAIQASTDCWSPAGWLKPDPHMKFQTAHTQRQICAQKRAECAAVATQPCPSLSISNESNRAHNDVPDMTQQAVTSIHSNAYQSDSALDALLEPNRQALQQCEGSTPQLAQGGALQAGVHEQPQEGGHRLAYAVSQEQADASGKQQGSVQGTTEGDGGQKGLVPEQGAAAMAAWLLQQPKLLQGLLDQLENIAAPGEARRKQQFD